MSLWHPLGLAWDLGKRRGGHDSHGAGAQWGVACRGGLWRWQGRRRQVSQSTGPACPNGEHWGQHSTPIHKTTLFLFHSRGTPTPLATNVGHTKDMARARTEDAPLQNSPSARTERGEGEREHLTRIWSLSGVLASFKAK